MSELIVERKKKYYYYYYYYRQWLVVSKEAQMHFSNTVKSSRCCFTLQLDESSILLIIKYTKKPTLEKK